MHFSLTLSKAPIKKSKVWEGERRKTSLPGLNPSASWLTGEWPLAMTLVGVSDPGAVGRGLLLGYWLCINSHSWSALCAWVTDGYCVLPQTTTVSKMYILNLIMTGSLLEGWNNWCSNGSSMQMLSYKFFMALLGSISLYFYTTHFKKNWKNEEIINHILFSPCFVNTSAVYENISYSMNLTWTSKSRSKHLFRGRES